MSAPGTVVFEASALLNSNPSSRDRVRVVMTCDGPVVQVSTVVASTWFAQIDAAATAEGYGRGDLMIIGGSTDHGAGCAWREPTSAELPAVARRLAQWIATSFDHRSVDSSLWNVR